MDMRSRNRMTLRILVAGYLVYLGINQFRAIFTGTPEVGNPPAPVMALFGILFIGVGGLYAWFAWRAMKRAKKSAEETPAELPESADAAAPLEMRESADAAAASEAHESAASEMSAGQPGSGVFDVPEGSSAGTEARVFEVPEQTAEEPDGERKQ
ncbi:MAG: hypothetical protein IJJ38_07430 [Lachnospiraceae bacterium]|nr:hypothetical protein [Lachnospiraceae bacterium]